MLQGFDTRTAMDWTDHVWAEIYIPSLGRWCHADPCEASWYSPPPSFLARARMRVV